MRFYTIDEARLLLPQVIPVLEQLRNGVAHLRALQEEAAVAAERSTGNGHVHSDPFASAMGARERLETLEQEMRDAAARLDAWGIELKDASRGLIDFYAYRAGEPVFLCFLLGEPDLAFWHPLDAGFAGRQPLETD